MDFQHREPFPPNPLLAGVVEFQYDESRGSYITYKGMSVLNKFNKQLMVQALF